MINDKNEIVEVVNENDHLIKKFFGEGGKGGGGSSGAVEATDTLRNNSFVNALELLSEGQINGLHTGDGQSVFINGTPLQNSDATYNFQGASYAIKTGSLSQTYIPGFASVNNTIGVGISVLQNSPVTQGISSSAVDAVRVTLTFSNGLKTQDTKTGNVNGGSVQYAVYKKIRSSNTWTVVVNETKTGKSNSAYSWQVYVPRAGTGVNWDIKVQRITADASSSAVVDLMVLSSIVEIQEVKLAYPGFAYAGLTLDARQFGSQIPVRSYLIDGVNMFYPSNYNPSNGTFSGMWDATLLWGFCNDPAWVLYDLLTNSTYGAGLYGILPSQIDKFSFYNASVFNNAQVGDGHGGTERRFTFNAAIAARSDMLTLLLNVAGMMNATLVYVNGLITLVQDRPTEASVVVNKSNVIDGLFTYKSTPLNTYTTAANITYTNKANNYLPVVTNITADATASAGWMGGINGVSKYGYNPTNIAAYGATTEGQAQRAARWYIYANLHQNEIAEFSMGLEGFRLKINDVVSLYDEDYTSKAGAGRVVSATSNTITFDRGLVVDGSSPSVSVVLPDGVTYETHAITGGSYLTCTIANAGTTLNQQTGATGVATSGWTVIPTQGCVYNVTSVVAPRPFRIIDIKQNTANTGLVDVTGVVYDKNNYTAIETGVTVPAGVYTIPQYLILSSPQSISFSDTSYITTDNIVKRTIIITWLKPAIGTADHYTLKYRRDNNNFITVENIQQTTYEILDVIEGTYDVNIFAVNANQLMSLPGQATHVVSLSPGTGSPLHPVTDLTVVGGGVIFNVLDLNAQWTNPLTNDNTNGVLKEFQVDVYSGAVKLRSDKVASVLPGAVAKYSYTYNMNSADNPGGPIRSPKLSVFCVDLNKLTSVSTTTTFNNPSPASPTGIVVTPGVGQVFVSYNFPGDLDYKGTMIWMSLTSGFSASGANLAYDGSDNSTTLKSLGNGIHYLRLGSYDSFGKDNSGIGMNLSGEYSTTPTNLMQIGNAFLYQWSVTSPPTGPSGNTTWTWATLSNANYTGGGGWSTTIPSNPGSSGVLLWVASTHVTDYLGVATTLVPWTGVPYVAWAGNAIGVAGTSVYTATVYLQTGGAAPSAPTGGSYHFSQNVLVAPSGWTITQPPSTTTPTYASDYTFSTNTIDILVAGGTWGTPYIDAVSGTPGGTGASGYSVWMAEIYQQTGGGVPATPIGGSYNFSTDTLTPPSGWSRFPPTASTVPTYRCGLLFNTNTPGVTVVNSAYWSTPVVYAQLGATGSPGASGVQTAYPTVYQWASSIPAGPVGSPYYNWSTTGFGAAPSGWSLNSGTTPSVGYTLWGASVSIVDSANSSSTQFNWSNAVITARGYAGANGSPGVSIIFQGSFASVAALISARGALQPGWSYYNSTDKKSYVYQSSSWYQMTIDGVAGGNGTNGTNGLPIVWKGESTNPPASPVLNWVYKDTDNGEIYIYNGSAWELMVLDGTDGANGTAGSNGFSVYITYNDNAVTSAPATPASPGFGTQSGWHTNATAAVNWMSQKVAADAYNGTWGSPIQIAGADGTNGLNGANGVNGTNGAAGSTGASALIGYAVVPSSFSPASTPNPYTGGWLGTPKTLPQYNTWGMAEWWYWNPPAFSANQTLYQTMGIYDPSTGLSVWGVPFISSLKVGSLSAITVNTGGLTVNGLLTMATTGQIQGGQTSYGTGTGFFLGYSGGYYKFSLGTGVSGLTWDGLTLSVPAATITGKLTAGQINANGLSIYTSGGALILNAGASIQSQINPYTSGATVNQSDTTTNNAIGVAATTANYNGLSGTPSAAIANSSVTLGANGTLSGAGGGTVTIGGLGYTGALDATKNQSDTTTNNAISGVGTTATNAATAASAATTAANAATTAAAAATTALTTKLNSNARNVLAGAGGIATGTLNWYSDGSYAGGYGIGITAKGLVAYKSPGYTCTFVLDGTTGDATFAGALNAASGTFSGTLTATAINAVDTINVRGNAITIPLNSFTNGAQGMSGGGYPNAVTMIIPTAGSSSSVIINICADYVCIGNYDGGESGGYTPTPVYFSIYRQSGYSVGGYQLYQSFQNLGSFGGSYMFTGHFSTTFVDVPGAGTWTYALYVSPAQAVMNTSIIATASMR